MRVYVIDDSVSAVASIRHIIETLEGCEVSTFTHPVAACAALETNAVDLLLVDYAMPEMNGIELIRHIRHNGPNRETPVIMITGQSDSAIKLAAMEAGAIEFLNKPFDTSELTIRVRTMLALRRAHLALEARARSLETEISASLVKIEKREEEIIWRLAKAMACRDGDTGDHLQRVAAVARLIAEELGLGEQHARVIYLASPLHDVGKVGVRDAILLKPDRLTEEEMEEMRGHAAAGALILSDSSSVLIQTAEKIAACHHEKWNGRGYPNGLSGTQIPIEARIVAVADVFDALCSERPYKSAWTIQAAFREIVGNSATHFDPDCVAAFCRCWPRIRTLYEVPEDLASRDPASFEAERQPATLIETCI